MNKADNRDDTNESETETLIISVYRAGQHEGRDGGNGDGGNGDGGNGDGDNGDGCNADGGNGDGGNGDGGAWRIFRNIFDHMLIV